MLYRIRIGSVFKGIFIFSVVVITILYHGYSTSTNAGIQNFDLFSAVIISVGFALSICMIRYNNS